VNPANSVDGEGVKFDPRTGFRVDTTGRDITEYYGEYKCVSKVISSKEKGAGGDEARSSGGGNSDEDFVIYNLFKAPSEYIKYIVSKDFSCLVFLERMGIDKRFL